MKVKIHQDQVSKLVVKDLKWLLTKLVDPKDDLHETLDNKAKIVSAFCEVLKFYTSEDDYNKIIKKLGKQDG